MPTPAGLHRCLCRWRGPALEGFEGQPAGSGVPDDELAVEDQILGQLLGNGDQDRNLDRAVAVQRAAYHVCEAGLGRHKVHKPRAPRGEGGQPTERFGTAFHSVLGMLHLEVRRSVNGILITSSPAEIDGAPASWQLRLRKDDDAKA